MQKSLLITAIALLMGLLVWLLLYWQPVAETGPAEHSREQAGQATGGDFQLHGADGPVDLADFRGQVVLLYFGYTWCPDICPTSLSLFSQVLDELKPAQSERVQPIFISVDPRRDNQARLKEYSAYFHERLIGLTGSEEEVARAAALYGVIYRAVNAETETNYAVDHSADSFLIDQQGQLVRRLPYGSSPEALLQAIHGLLSGKTQ